MLVLDSPRVEYLRAQLQTNSSNYKLATVDDLNPALP